MSTFRRSALPIAAVLATVLAGGAAQAASQAPVSCWPHSSPRRVIEAQGGRRRSSGVSSSLDLRALQRWD
jgi:hypothetical protein